MKGENNILYNSVKKEKKKNSPQRGSCETSIIRYGKIEGNKDSFQCSTLNDNETKFHYFKRGQTEILKKNGSGPPSTDISVVIHYESSLYYDQSLNELT